MGQNLIPNNSFEEYHTCPEAYSANSYKSNVEFWDSPNIGTPDYFNVCSKVSGVPRNWMGYADAFTGSAYMGIIACMEQLDARQIPYREYIRIEVEDSLQKGVKYLASMQVQLGLSAIAACNGLGMYFSNSPSTSKESFNYPVKPQVFYEDAIVNKQDWTNICGVFVAKGDEKYVIIGNFLSNQEMKYTAFDENLLQTQYTSPMAYYYIDDVQLVVFDSLLHADCDLIPEKPIVYNGVLQLDKKMILNNLYFEHDKAVILEESYHELDQLAYQLSINQKLSISIYGHTDNSGTDTYNKQLSDERANAVKHYLLRKGVSKFRMISKGFGSSQPIGDNTTEQGQQLNRRVEIEVK
ncbi:MAG: OmpA family protein [Salinivirgaceae bacterium]|nr:OmpA family protein [Salinivirgaceae bacterium]